MCKQSEQGVSRPGGRRDCSIWRVVIQLSIAKSTVHMGMQEGRNGLKGWRSEFRARPWGPQVLGQVIGPVLWQ